MGWHGSYWSRGVAVILLILDRTPSRNRGTARMSLLTLSDLSGSMTLVTILMESEELSSSLSYEREAKDSWVNKSSKYGKLWLFRLNSTPKFMVRNGNGAENSPWDCKSLSLAGSEVELGSVFSLMA